MRLKSLLLFITALFVICTIPLVGHASVSKEHVVVTTSEQRDVVFKVQYGSGKNEVGFAPDSQGIMGCVLQDKSAEECKVKYISLPAFDLVYF